MLLQLAYQTLYATSLLDQLPDYAEQRIATSLALITQ
jgi:hypothetical protein